MDKETCMENWRDTILKEFTPQVAKITVVADPDALLSEEVIIQEIQGRGFEIVVYEEPVSFRFRYESEFRSAWEAGERNAAGQIVEGAKELIILLRSGEDSFVKLPYDILSASRKLKFGLDRLFPHLNRNVLVQLDRSMLDNLFQAQLIYSPHQQSENATKDFILRHVFEIAPEMVKTPADLLRILLRKHYREQKVPPILDHWLVQMLQRTGRFTDWPLESLILDRETFLAFLQERWPAYLLSIETDQETVVRDFSGTFHPILSGPAILPFGHDDVRIYIDNLFAEGFLKPVSSSGLLKSATSGKWERQNYPVWVRMGIQSDPETERYTRLQKILQVIEEEFQPDTARYTDWLNLAQKWAEANVLWYSSPITRSRRETHNGYQPLKLKYIALRQAIDDSFPKWLQQRYGSLYNLPSVEPIMVHQIPRYMLRGLQSPDYRAALVIIDGLSFDQWVVIKEVLQHQLQNYKFLTTGTFAWIPTLTSVSRQSIFAGKPPMFFPDRIWNTNGEENLWTQLWSDAGLSEYQIYYRRLTGEYARFNRIEEDISGQQIRIVGLVIDKVDKIMHGMELGSAGMLNQIRQWAEQGELAKLIRFLIENYYQVFVSSDHGNIEATGCGQPGEGAIADLRGERARIYPSETLRSPIKAKFPKSVEWKPVGLPANFYPLFAPERTAFVQNEKHTVCHGGISLEEVIVPFIRVEKQ